MLQQISGNARTCVYMEPLFVVPFGMFTTYASIYMLHLRVTPTEIGLITTINMVMQMFSAFISGYVTDVLGRRKALWVFDVISWSVATVVWSMADNVWWFLVAAIFNSFQRIPSTAWYCLLVEDTEPSKRTFVFRGLQVVGLIGGLFAPIAGMLIRHLTLVPAVRVMYLFACVSMSCMIYFRHRGTHETEMGIRKMQERSGFNVRKALQQYLDTLVQIAQNRALLLLFIVYALWNFQSTMNSTFLPVYQAEFLGIPTALISLFPAFSSVTMVILLLTVLPRFREEQAERLMGLGFACLVAANLILVFMPRGHFVLVVVSTVLAATGTIIANPYLESVVANAIDDEHRATLLAVLGVLILLFTSPAGIIGGWTYSINPRIPIGLILGSFLASILLVAWVHRHRARQTRG